MVPVRSNGRCFLSDGVHTVSAFLATQLKERLKSGEITETTICKVDKFSKQAMPGKTKMFIMILDVEVLAKEAAVVGAPTSLDGTAVASVKVEVKSEGTMSPVAAKKPAPVDSPVPGGPSAATPTNTPPKMAGSPIAQSTGDQNVVPIADINPYMGRWSIKGRIVAKKVTPHAHTPPPSPPHPR